MPITAKLLELFSKATIVRQAPGAGAGYWAGAPGICFDPLDKALYLTYRLRRPRGVPLDRGGEARIARSTDFVRFEDVWSMTKNQLSTASIERCALRRDPRGQWRYYASYVDPQDGRWCVSEMSAATIPELDPSRSRPLFKASALGLEGIKDPWLYEKDGQHYMFLSVALKTEQTQETSHDTLDIFNTGDCLSATALALSRDLQDWQWKGVVFTPPSSAWDRYCRRLNSLIQAGDRYLGFYDGSASHQDNYEEKTGLAESPDLLQWRCLTQASPALTSAHASGSLRYVESFQSATGVQFFFEAARADGAHDLAMSQLTDLLNERENPGATTR